MNDKQSIPDAMPVRADAGTLGHTLDQRKTRVTGEAVYAFRLRPGMSIDGRRIETLTSRTAFGFVTIDWDFGSADSSDIVRNVWIPPGLTLVDTKAHRPTEIQSCRECPCCYTPRAVLEPLAACSDNPEIVLDHDLSTRHPDCRRVGTFSSWPESDS